MSATARPAPEPAPGAAPEAAAEPAAGAAAEPAVQPAGRDRLEPPPVPALVVGRVTHTRHQPRRYRLGHRHYQWLLDVDDPPRLPWPLRPLARVEPRDHLDGGRLGGGIRGDLERFLRGRGVRLEPSDRVLMLTHPRLLGHTFNPLTIYWCLTPDGRPRAVVFEVHNTHRERHAYLLDLDHRGRGRVAKAFAVSPFLDTSGHYRIALRLDPRAVAVRVVLDHGGRPVLTATAGGVPRPATPATVLRTALTHPLMPQRVTALIRWHGVRLWLRRLPIHPRSPHPKEAVR